MVTSQEAGLQTQQKVLEIRIHKSATDVCLTSQIDDGYFLYIYYDDDNDL